MPDQRDLAVHDLLFFIVCSLVDYPREVRIESDYAEDGATFTVRVHPADVGKLIGKQGRSASALRTLLGAAGAKLRRRFAIDIDDGSTE